jgi:predicted phosphodiesterase
VNRVAVITDIHANLPALEATLEEIGRLGADAVYCGGDLVGYGPHPNEVCRTLEERAVPTIYGNYDPSASDRSSRSRRGRGRSRTLRTGARTWRGRACTVG